MHCCRCCCSLCIDGPFHCCRWLGKLCRPLLITLLYFYALLLQRTFNEKSFSIMCPLKESRKRAHFHSHTTGYKVHSLVAAVVLGLAQKHQHQHHPKRTRGSAASDCNFTRLLLWLCLAAIHCASPCSSQPRTYELLSPNGTEGKSLACGKCKY